MSTNEKDPTVIVASFQITKPMANGASLVISGHFYNKDDPAAIDARLDEWNDRASRQFERNGLEMRVAERAKHVDNLDRIRVIYESLVAKKQAGQKLKTQEQQQYDAGQQTIKAATEQIDKIDQGIAEAKKKVGIK